MKSTKTVTVENGIVSHRDFLVDGSSEGFILHFSGPQKKKVGGGGC